MFLMSVYAHGMCFGLIGAPGNKFLLNYKVGCFAGPLENLWWGQQPTYRKEQSKRGRRYPEGFLVDCPKGPNAQTKNVARGFAPGCFMSALKFV